MTETEQLLEALSLEEVSPDLFSGRCPDFGWRRVFGGQLLAQALTAAQHTVADDRFVHSLHCYFHHAADISAPILYQASRIRDGRSLAARRVEVTQNGRIVLSLEASFHMEEGGPGHQAAMTMNVPQPDSLPDPAAFLEQHGERSAQATRNLWKQRSPFEVRPVILDHYVSRSVREPRQQVWMRPKAPLDYDRKRNAAILAYMSDISLLGVTTFAHGAALTDPVVKATSSLSHAMWFHRPCQISDWLLYSQDSPSTQNALGLAHGSMYASDGTLVATVVQEGLVRFANQAMSG